MKAGSLAAWLAPPLLAGCIPHADAPYPRDYPPPPARERPARPTPARAEPASEEVRDANRRSLDEQRARANAGDPDSSPGPARRPTPAPPATLASAPTRATWDARPVGADAELVSERSVTVAPGETLQMIARRAGAGVGAIARANGLASAEAIRAGQRLRVPGGRYHVVGPGQSGIAIARAYGVPWARIVDANGLAEPYVLHVGERILIPGEAGRPSSAAERAAAFSLNIDDILTGGEPALATNEAPARPVATASRVLPPSAAVAPPARLAGGFDWPAEGRVVRRFGAGASGERNDGVDLAMPLETPVKASADGVVAYAGDGIAALGGLVIVKHGGGWTTVYAHADKLLVRRGQSVKRGQTIALSGDTGFVDRPELHFELRKGRLPVDPATQLPRL